MELVESLCENEWVFQDPTLTDDIETKFNEALEAYEDERDAEAETLARSVVNQCPNHIDALNHLGLYCEDRSDAIGSYVFCQAAVAVGLQAIPPNFRWESHRIPWSLLSNRPFLRAYHCLGIHRMEQGAWHDAIAIFKRLLAINPHDNQGVRYVLPQCWFETENETAIIAHCALYADDDDPHILYSKALALAIVKRFEAARTAIQDAVAARPLVALELVKHLHVEPKRKHPGRITVGGADEAWEYWRTNGRYWHKSKPAMDTLREATAKERTP